MAIRSRLLPSVLPACAALLAGSAHAQAGTAGAAHPGLLWLCAALFVAVFVAMLLAIWRHRRQVKRRGESMGEPGWVELCWTLIPILIVAGAAWPVFRLLTE
ncbi:MAG: hypothetical protein GAK30_01448 [Paracidovorax wautersii]|uniref:Cytochrome oxidase subunit II transmembrane region profile domain-containing protein n=1 Tax=Paracidovorax wautersii TaxID=1177982 RepID=A0A7V8FQ06_9BURK|nr:MAG: hypothetical protein GAK30_01448 [Paracidovorax wautersii]